MGFKKYKVKSFFEFILCGYNTTLYPLHHHIILL